MSEDKDHTTLIVICVLLGVVLLTSVAIIASVYNNNQNIERDKFIVQHCKVVSGSASSILDNNIEYNCGSK